MEQATEQTKIIGRDIAKVAQDQMRLAKRFDRHLEIYAQNGKELSKLTSSIDALKNSFENRNTYIDNDQTKQWLDIKAMEKETHTLALSVNTIISKTALWSGVGSAIASAVAVAMVLTLLNIGQ